MKVYTFIAGKLFTLKISFVLIILLVSFASYSQSDLRKVPVSSLPEDIQNVPDISVAFRWTDTLGDNVLVITKKIIKRDDEDRVIYHGRRSVINYPKDSRNKDGSVASRQIIPSNAHHFIVIKDSAIKTWTIVTISKLCEGEDDNHTKNWTIITDLDKNAIAEIWVISKAECINDPNGGTMEIVMHQDAYMYIMNGTLNTASPEVNPDNNFRNGPEIFRKYALVLW